MTTATPPELVAISYSPVDNAPTLVSPPPETRLAPPTRSRELPSLDGLRSLSRLSIVFGHSAQGHTRLLDVISNRFGVCGVNIFFVISGYLITTVMWKDIRRNGNVSLRRFYWRRMFRILPPFYAYLAVIAIGGVIGLWVLPVGTRWWPAITFTSNLFNPRAWLIGHSWTLAIEEQYYLMWPITLAWCIRNRGVDGGIRLGGRIVIGTMLVLPLIRVLVFGLSRDGNLAANVSFDFVAAGSGIALFQESGVFERGQRFIRAMDSRYVMPIAGATALILHLLFNSSKGWVFAASIIVVSPIEAVLLALFISWCIQHPKRPIGKVLNYRPLRIIGVGSYGLYLWQQLFLGPHATYHWPFAVSLLALCACAAASYWLIEQPSLRLRPLLEQKLFRQS